MASEAEAILSEMPHLLHSLAGEAGACLAHSMPFSWHFLGPTAFLFGVTLSGTDMTADSWKKCPEKDFLWCCHPGTLPTKDWTLISWSIAGWGEGSLLADWPLFMPLDLFLWGCRCVAIILSPYQQAVLAFLAWHSFHKTWCESSLGNITESKLFWPLTLRKHQCVLPPYMCVWVGDLPEMTNRLST